MRSFRLGQRELASCLLLGLLACGSTRADLFGRPAGGGAGSESGGAGSDSGGSAAGREDFAPAGGGAGGDRAASGSAGIAGSEPVAGESSGGSAQGGVAGSGATGAIGAAAGSAATGAIAGDAGTFTDCAQFGNDATWFSQTQHCYLAVHDLLTFAAAQQKCAALGAHLVTIANEAENDFAWDVLSEEHWVGARDGKGPKESGVGTYTWLTGEPLDYSAWSAEQPNASKTACGDSNGGGTCYEHCAFQWASGEKNGEWNDRYCLHTVASICEWGG